MPSAPLRKRWENIIIRPQQMRVDYKCCGAVYLFEIRLPRNGLLLHGYALADTAIMYCDRVHDAQHPECEEK